MNMNQLLSASQSMFKTTMLLKAGASGSHFPLADTNRR